MYVNKNLLLSKMSLRGHNISTLAEATGSNRDTISNILNGKTAPSYPVINSIFYELELTPEEAVDIFLALTYVRRKLKYKGGITNARIKTNQKSNHPIRCCNSNRTIA